MRKSGKIKKVINIIINTLILSLIIFALARPRYTENFETKSTEVIDILLVLDISSSMLADDFPPNRLESVKKTANKFIKTRENDRIGIVVFAGESFIQCPLTVDKNVLETLIKEITIAQKEYDGTAIGMAIANATNRLRKTTVENKVMILLSDGSNNKGEIDPETAAELAASFNIKIYTIGAGTNKSYTRIPDRGMIKNEIDEETLKNIAKITNGKYFRAIDENALENIYNEIDMLERSVIEVKQHTTYKELFGWLLTPALILALILQILNVILFRYQT
jgi:Ca-activated chloride channel family protein